MTAGRVTGKEEIAAARGSAAIFQNFREAAMGVSVTSHQLRKASGESSIPLGGGNAPPAGPEDSTVQVPRSSEARMQIRGGSPARWRIENAARRSHRAGGSFRPLRRIPQ